ncbi:MAG: hypothetical protein IBX43_05645 [Campylobacterales bacterium]|nr:hypothetical protein [Campylobacterales bacterium]
MFVEFDNTQPMLDKGIPVYIKGKAYPKGIVKKYPDGKMELVSLDKNYNEYVVRKIAV